MVVQAFQHLALSAWERSGAELLALEIICVNGKLSREAGKVSPAEWRKTKAGCSPGLGQ